jgi:hypothetical protein
MASPYLAHNAWGMTLMKLNGLGENETKTKHNPKKKLAHSPKKSTAVTEMRMAKTGLVIRSKKMGKASIAIALERRRVTRRKWCFFTTGRIRAAYFRSRGVPEFFRI